MPGSNTRGNIGEYVTKHARKLKREREVELYVGVESWATNFED
jgi:hypothetical protein